MKHLKYLLIIVGASLSVCATAGSTGLSDAAKDVKNGNMQAALKIASPLAKNGVPEAEYLLGQIYSDGGGGVSQDLARGGLWYKKSAEHGYGDAEAFIGFLYSKGQLGFPVDFEKSKYWLKKSALQNNALAFDFLGMIYRDGGDGIKQDYHKAAIWFMRAAKIHDAIGEEALGSAYLYGQGVQRNYGAAMSLFKESANLPSMYQIGYMYQHGSAESNGVPDFDKAMKWYRKAAAQGFAAAENQIGYLYSLGFGVNEDQEKSFSWYMKAARQGYNVAEYSVGMSYKTGLGVAKNRSEAIFWLKKAAAGGYTDARRQLGRLGVK